MKILVIFLLLKIQGLTAKLIKKEMLSPNRAHETVENIDLKFHLSEVKH